MGDRNPYDENGANLRLAQQFSLPRFFSSWLWLAWRLSYAFAEPALSLDTDANSTDLNESTNESDDLENDLNESFNESLNASLDESPLSSRLADLYNSTRWEVGEWGECLQAYCRSDHGLHRRSVTCFALSEEGEVAMTDDVCLNFVESTCTDQPGWADGSGADCDAYRLFACGNNDDEDDDDGSESSDFSEAPWLLDSEVNASDSLFGLTASQACCPCPDTSNNTKPSTTKVCYEFELISDCVSVSPMVKNVSMHEEGAPAKANLTLANPFDIAIAARFQVVDSKYQATYEGRRLQRREDKQLTLPESRRHDVPWTLGEKDRRSPRETWSAPTLLDASKEGRALSSKTEDGLEADDVEEGQGEGASGEEEEEDDADDEAGDEAADDGWSTEAWSDTEASDESCGGRLILRFKESVEEGLSRRLGADASVGVKSWKLLKRVNMDIAEVDCGSVGSASEALQHVKEKYAKSLEIAELDQKVTHLARVPGGETNDSWDLLQWNFERIQLREAWKRLATLGGTRKEIVVAIVDSGIEAHHPEFASTRWMNSGEIPGNGIDDDNNGFVDDVYGYDFVLDAGSYEDPLGHGTHCAGVVAAGTNNSQGQGFYSNVIAAMDYALDKGAMLSSHSWAGPTSSALEAAFATALDAGHLVVTSAGNSARDHDSVPKYPCDIDLDNIICVGSVGAGAEGGYQQSSFTDFNPDYVDIAAPGEAILSTFNNNNYKCLQGTSMAAPHVTGAIALVMSNFPNLTWTEVKTLLLQTGSHKDEHRDWVANGVLDVNAFVAAAAGGNASHWVKPVDGQDISIDAEQNRSVDLLVGDDSLRPGHHSASLNVSWEGAVPGYTLVDVNLVVQSGTDGFAYVSSSTTFDMTNSGLEGTVTVKQGSLQAKLAIVSTSVESVRYSISGHDEDDAWSFEYPGNGTATLDTEETHYLIATCTPTATGTFSKEIVIRTNLHLSAEDASSSNALQKGTTYTFPLTCISEPVPALTLTSPSSSAVEATAGGEEISIFAYIAADWNNYLAETTTTASLFASSFEGCGSVVESVSGKIVLVSITSSCSIATQARTLASAGALGLLVFSSKDTPFTTQFIYQTLTVDDGGWPSIPTFQVPWWSAQDLTSALSAGKEVTVTLTWDPPLNGVPLEDTTIDFVLSNSGNNTFNYDVMIVPAFNGNEPTDFYTSSLRTATLTDLDSLEELVMLWQQDDNYTNVTLPFTFPFFWEKLDWVTVSTNGFLSWGDGGSYMYLSGNVTESESVIAPAFADLDCRDNCRISAGSIDEGEMFVVQWRDIAFFDLEDETISFEARLYRDGSIGLVYRDFTRVGLQRRFEAGFAASNGFSKGIASSQLHVPDDAGSGGETFFKHWGVTIDNPTGALAAGASSTVSVTLAAGTDLPGLVSIEAAYPSGSGGKSMVLPLAWPGNDYCEYTLGQWSSCQVGSCVDGSATGAHTREVLCLNIETSAACETKFCVSNWYASSSDDLPEEQQACQATCTESGETLTTTTGTTTRTTTTSTTTTYVSSGVQSRLVVASSMVITDDDDPSTEAIQSACITGLVNTLGVSSDGVIVIGSASADSGRRLADAWRLSFKVVYDSSEDGAAESAAVGRAQLQALSNDSSPLLSEIQAALEDLGLDSSSFAVVAEEPSAVTTETVGWVAGSFSSCTSDDMESLDCGETFTGIQTRMVYCADISTSTPAEVSASECAGLSNSLLAEQACSGTTEECDKDSSGACETSAPTFFSIQTSAAAALATSLAAGLVS